jgi:hypothetical protein
MTLALLLLLAAGSPVAAQPLPAFQPGWEQRTFWDLRGYASPGDAALASATKVVAEERLLARGIALLPAGPREVGLYREAAGGRLRYRFVERSGATVALFEGPEPRATEAFIPDRAGVLQPASGPSGITVPYTSFHNALQPGRTGFLQYSSGQTLPLSSIDPAWTSVAAMITPMAQAQGDVWDFTGLQTASLNWRTFNTTRNDLAGAACPGSCAVRDLSTAPADGSWQEWLKIDHFNPTGARATRDVFFLNDNDTGSNPSIDVPYLVQDELDTSDRTQLCFQGSGGGASRLLRFFRFTGADPLHAVMSYGDTWTSGAWTTCTAAAGLNFTLASQCGDSCYPGCTSILPYARGMLTSGAGFRATIVEDGYVHVPAGNYLPALLLRQDTDLQAGRNLLGTCNLGTTRERSFDYFWLQERYGLLALVSAPSDSTGTLPPDDWSSIGNMTDRVDVTWGPFPPYQMATSACLAGTQVRWSLPADGSNPGSAPGISQYGYVVSWGQNADPESLADWTANPNHTPLPGEAGYLAAPAGAEPTSYVVTSWPGASMDATVTTALDYTDPDLADTRAYRSAAFFTVTQNPARLDPAAFVIGDGVTPFVSVSGADLVLSWPAVAGAGSYLLRVYDLVTKQEIACPAGLDCAPTSPQATHAGAATSALNLGYRVFAVDPCGGVSSN